MPAHHQHCARRVDRRDGHRLRQQDHVLVETHPVRQIARHPLERAPTERAKVLFVMHPPGAFLLQRHTAARGRSPTWPTPPDVSRCDGSADLARSVVAVP